MIAIYIVLVILISLVVLALVTEIKKPPMPKRIADDDIRQMAQQGHKIDAIRMYRTLHGAGLKQAKEAVERMMKEGE